MVLLYLTLFVFVCGAFSFAERDMAADSDVVEPEYLDMLLRTKNYEEFARVMGIENVELVKPGSDSDRDPMFNEGLEYGDMILTKQQSEEARQGILFDKYPGNKWQNNRVPYTISSDFTATNRRNIQDAIAEWNSKVRCVKWVARNGEKDYVNFFPGNGCWSYLGKIGDAQALSLQQNGCFRRGTILHEMDHAIGFAHEHCRNDRDNFIQILWENIPSNWQRQYEKTNPRDFGTQLNYDYYSVMHYPVPAPPDGSKPAFRVLQNGVNEGNIGQRVGFTDTDLGKISQQYC